ncbi:MAG: tyrosine-type recombinase/integrase [Deltaproteobacteria bacterium]|nr:tyrosine-type recombinase/integrase [Deltaproteobacteria bacterium]
MEEGKLLLGANRVTFERLEKLLLDDYRVNDRSSLADAQRRIDKHLDPHFRGRRAQEITSADVQGYIAKRKSEGARNSTINRELAALRRMYNLAIRIGVLARAPHVPTLEENNVRTGFFERSQFESVLAKLPEWLRAPVTFAYHTGWRMRDEVLQLKWSNVDLDAGVVRLEPGTTKNKDGRVIFATDELAALLQGQLDIASRYPQCDLVFHRDGKVIKTFHGRFREACGDAGVPDRIPHDFRRTAVRNMIRAGIPERVAMQMSGHKTRSVFDRYHIVAEGDLREAAARLNAAFRSSAATDSATVDPGQAPQQSVTV